jgi:hypothetical protein
MEMEGDGYVKREESSCGLVWKPLRPFLSCRHFSYFAVIFLITRVEQNTCKFHVCAVSYRNSLFSTRSFTNFPIDPTVLRSQLSDQRNES